MSFLHKLWKARRDDILSTADNLSSDATFVEREWLSSIIRPVRVGWLKEKDTFPFTDEMWDSVSIWRDFGNYRPLSKRCFLLTYSFSPSVAFDIAADYTQDLYHPRSKHEKLLSLIHTSSKERWIPADVVNEHPGVDGKWDEISSTYWFSEGGEFYNSPVMCSRIHAAQKLSLPTESVKPAILDFERLEQHLTEQPEYPGWYISMWNDKKIAHCSTLDKSISVFHKWSKVHSHQKTLHPEEVQFLEGFHAFVRMCPWDIVEFEKIPLDKIANNHTAGTHTAVVAEILMRFQETCKKAEEIANGGNFFNPVATKLKLMKLWKTFHKQIRGEYVFSRAKMQLSTKKIENPTL